ncbi:hypothetical protein KIPB_016463, partial [Kipferlia bialata]|eukprot:g16463.t1
MLLFLLGDVIDWQPSSHEKFPSFCKWYSRNGPDIIFLLVLTELIALTVALVMY